MKTSSAGWFATSAAIAGALIALAPLNGGADQRSAWAGFRSNGASPARTSRRAATPSECASAGRSSLETPLRCLSAIDSRIAVPRGPQNDDGHSGLRNDGSTRRGRTPSTACRGGGRGTRESQRFAVGRCLMSRAISAERGACRPLWPALAPTGHESLAWRGACTLLAHRGYGDLEHVALHVR